MYPIEYTSWQRQKSVPGTMLTNRQTCTVNFASIDTHIGSSTCSGDN